MDVRVDGMTKMKAAERSVRTYHFAEEPFADPRYTVYTVLISFSQGQPCTYSRVKIITLASWPYGPISSLRLVVRKTANCIMAPGGRLSITNIVSLP